MRSISDLERRPELVMVMLDLRPVARSRAVTVNKPSALRSKVTSRAGLPNQRNEYRELTKLHSTIPLGRGTMPLRVKLPRVLLSLVIGRSPSY
jgi:hypothetical protein